MGTRRFLSRALLAVVGLLALAAACTTNSGRTARHDYPPITATISKAPKLWEPVTVTCTVKNESPFRYLNVEAWVDLTEDPISPQPVYLDGNLYWQGALNPGEAATVSALVAFTEVGDGAGHCRARILQEYAQESVEYGLVTEPFAVRKDHGYFNPYVPNGTSSPSPPPNAYSIGTRALIKNSPLATADITEPLLLIINSQEELQQAVDKGLFPREAKYEWRKVFDTNFDTHSLMALFGPTGPTVGYSLDTAGGWVKGKTVILDVTFREPPPTAGFVNRPSTPVLVLWEPKGSLPPGALRFVASQGCVQQSPGITFLQPPKCTEVVSTIRDVGGLGPPEFFDQLWRKGLEEEKSP